MTERITEANLQDIETKAARFRDGIGGEIVTVFALCCLDLTAEVRRLRGLIAAGHFDPLMADQTGKPKEPLYDALIRYKSAQRVLEAEAEAIRAESPLT